MRHFNMFSFVLVSMFVISGCYSSHGNPDLVAPMVDDSNPFVGGDAGPTEPDAGPTEPDAGPIEVDAGSDAFVPMEDAGSDAGPIIEPDAGLPVELVMDPFFSGWSTPAGQQDMATADIRATATHDLVWDGSLMFQIEATGGGCMVRGSGGTDYFHDIKIKNTDTGVTMMGPVTMPTLANGSTSTGFFRIGSEPRSISAGTTLRFAVTMDLSAAEDAPREFLGCSYRVHTGTTDGSIIEASAIRFPGGETLRPEQIGGDNAASYSGFNVDVPVPDFHIEAFDMRPSTILVAGGGIWQQTASYWVGPDETLTSVFVTLNGDAADIANIAILTDGRVLGTGTHTGGINPTVRVDLAEPFVVLPGERHQMDVRVMIPNVSPLSATSGSSVGVCNSGDVFSVGVSGAIRVIRSARVRTDFAPIMGNEFVIRKSKPTFVRRSLSTTTINNGSDQELYKFQVAADSAGSIELARIGMSMEINSAAGRVCNLRVRRGSSEMSSTDYSISGPMFWGTDRCWTAGILPLIIHFLQTVTGSGNSYTVFGTPEGFVAGDTITVSFALYDATVATGDLHSVWSSTWTDIALDLSPYGAPLSTRDSLMGHLTWSDLSEIPHSAEFGTSGGSRDWTNGYLIEDLTQTSTLSR